MLKKMRWRFISAAMAAFFAVIAGLLCLINAWNYVNVARQQDETLQKLLAADRSSAELPAGVFVPPFDSLDRFSPEVPYMIRFFSVHYDQSGAVIRVNQTYIASITQAEAQQYASAVLSGSREKGYYNSYRYLISTGKNGTSVLFLNSERELQTVESLLWITAAIAGISLAIVFVLVVILSRRAISPYIRNLETQKQFITNASHELKTPLTAISTSADVLALDLGENEWVRNIQNQAGRLSKLITNLVTLSRLDEENPFPARTEFSLSDAIWETAEPFSALAQAQNKGYTLDIADGLTLWGDRASIQQMISILLDNAVKYSPVGGSIALTARNCGRRTEITVRSTCLGDSFDVSHLFDRFYRGDAARAGSVSGTGIGLSIAKATAEAHNGSIAAEQRGDQLSFTVRL